MSSDMWGDWSIDSSTSASFWRMFSSQRRIFLCVSSNMSEFSGARFAGDLFLGFVKDFVWLKDIGSCDRLTTSFWCTVESEPCGPCTPPILGQYIRPSGRRPKQLIEVTCKPTSTVTGGSSMYRPTRDEYLSAHYMYYVCIATRTCVIFNQRRSVHRQRHLSSLHAVDTT